MIILIRIMISLGEILGQIPFPVYRQQLKASSTRVNCAMSNTRTTVCGPILISAGTITYIDRYRLVLPVISELYCAV